jgi:[acyl-carrier-protein] S-malonyltransferase
MAAVIGLSYEETNAVLEKIEGEEVYLANYSSPIQIVLAGTAEGLNRAEKLFDEAGAMKYVHLKVSGPFHCPLLKEARDGLEEALSEVCFADPKKPVYANVSGKRITTGEEAKQLLTQQVVTTVRWVDEEQSILDDGYERFLEVGPGKVLSGLWKSFYKKKRCQLAGTVDAIHKVTAPE